MTQPAEAMRGTFADAIRDAQAELLSTNPKVVILGESVGRLGGVHGTCRDLLPSYDSEKVQDLPLTEAGLVGYALGLSMAGAIPIVELTGPDRVPALMDQLVNEAATMVRRTHGEFKASLVLRIPCGAGIGGGPFMESSPAGLLSTIEGLTVVAPSSPEEASGMLLGAIGEPGPVVILESHRLYPTRGSYDLCSRSLASAHIARPGDDCTVLSYGGGVGMALAAADRLWQEESIDTEVVDLRCLAPLDVATLAASIEKTGHVVLAIDGPDAGAEHLLHAASGPAFLSLESPPQSLVMSQNGVSDLVNTVLKSTLY